MWLCVKRDSIQSEVLTRWCIALLILVLVLLQRSQKLFDLVREIRLLNEVFC